MRTTLTMAAAAVLLSGCAGMHGHGHGSGPSARAVLEPTRGNTTTGTVMFHTTANGVFVHARVSGLKPGQEHGFHIHEKGDCSSGDGMSTGGHFNPGGKPHAHPSATDRHTGDLPSLQADAQGKADLRIAVQGPSIGSGVTDIVGKGLIVHAMPDDYKTQPTGNAGARIACAVIAAR